MIFHSVVMVWKKEKEQAAVQHVCSDTALEHGFCLVCCFNVPGCSLCSMTPQSGLSPGR